jgi:hypothetical protein
MSEAAEYKGETIPREFLIGMKNQTLEKISPRRRGHINLYKVHVFRKLRKRIEEISRSIRNSDPESFEGMVDNLHAICVLEKNSISFEEDIFAEFRIEYTCGDYESDEEMDAIKIVLNLEVLILMESLEKEYSNEIIDCILRGVRSIELSELIFEKPEGYLMQNPFLN